METGTVHHFLGLVFSMKHLLFSGFDTSPLGLPINKTQERVLMICWHNPNTTMQILSQRVGLEKGSLTSVVDSLEELGLVTRIRQEEDRRSFLVSPTPEGAALAKRIDRLLQRHFDDLIHNLTEEEKNEMARSMASLAGLIPRLAIKE